MNTIRNATDPAAQTSINNTIVRLLRQHSNEWYINAAGNPVLLTQCSHFHKDPNDPLHGRVTWHTELDELHTIRQTLAVLGY